MKLNEIEHNDERKQAVARAMKNVESMYGPRPKPDAVKVAQAQERAKAFIESKKDVESALEKIAQKMNGNQFEEFKQEALREVPQAERYVNLVWAFDTFNPERKAQTSKAWDAYGDERQNAPSGKYVGD